MKLILLSFLLFSVLSVKSQNTGLTFSDQGENYIVTPNVANAYPLNNFTIQFWLRNSKTSSNQSLLQKGWCYGGKMSWHLQLRDDNTVDFNFDSDGGCSSTNTYRCDSILDYGICYHITVTYSAVGVKFYYNGQLQTGYYSSGAYCGDLFNSLEPLRIGSYKLFGGSQSFFLNGMLDDISLWNRVLSQSEIQANYLNPLVGNENGLVIYYKLDETIVGPSVVVPNHATTWGSQLNGLTYSSNSNNPYSNNSCYAYNSINSITDNSTAFQAYPNPSGDQMIISRNTSEDPSSLYHIEIYDIRGKIAFNKVSTLPIILEKSNFNSGMYMIKVYNSEICNSSKIIFKE